MLMLKTNELKKKGTLGEIDYDEDYVQAGIAANRLITEIEAAANKFFIGTAEDNNTWEQFNQSIHEAVCRAKIDFAIHRGFWEQLEPYTRIILGVVALCLVIPAIATCFTSPGYYGTFFSSERPKTDSLLKLEQFETQYKSIAQP